MKRRKGKSKLDEETTLMSNAYYDPKHSASLGGKGELVKFLKTKDIKKTSITKWLRSQNAYTLHKPARKKFRRRATLVGGLNHQFQADLIDMQKFSRDNKGMKYIITVIDVFSKFGWAYPLKSKSGKEISIALKRILMERKCKYLQTDKGKEFYNSSVKNMLKDLSVAHFSTENDDIKASIVERFNRTLQSRLSRWFTKNQRLNWIEVLQDLVYSYNRTTHRSIGMAPINVSAENSEDVWLTLYGDLESPERKSLLKVGDTVRISKYKHIFSKGYEKNWSTEAFIVDEVLKTNPVTFCLRDMMNEKIIGSYYMNELQRIDRPEEFLIEEVLKQRKVGKNMEYLVKYEGYPPKFNQWIDSSQLVKSIQ